MNVYQRLSKAREIFHSSKIKKTGHNKFAGYDYFELADFIVPALQIFKECGLSGVVSYGKDEARLTITNMEKPEETIVVTSPMSTAALKGCHEVQNLGAVQTYLRRYLWVAALEIVEHDAIDATTGKDKPAPRHSPVPDVELSAEQKAHVDAIVADIVQCFADGDELSGIGLWYAKDTFSDNDERIYAWKALAAHSKIRSTLKSNKPE